MTPADIKSLVDVLQTGGPWALLAFVALAYVRKDRDLKELNREHMKVLLDVSLKNVKAMTVMRSSIDGLTKAMDALTARL